MRVLIIDGYVDEPTCLGVPPYISPYPRYIAGALVERGVKSKDIFYRTIDQLRQHKQAMRFDLIIIIAGVTVPGNYLRATPIRMREILELSQLEAIKVMGGPIRLGFGEQGGITAKKIAVSDIIIAEKDIEAYVYDLIENIKNPEDIEHRMRSCEEIGRWGVKGAFIIRQHPDYPHVMCEIETYRGCPRSKHCSFCTEPFYGEPEYREIEDVVREVSALYAHGARYFRIGRQPDLFMYKARDGVPDPNSIEKLYRGIRNVAPKLKVLHMDNANPATLARFPEESRKIAKIIVKYHTSGDVVALGMESADPHVIKANNLDAHPQEVLDAIKLLNEVGGARGESGLPELLPGINFVHGLKGETKKTFEMNYEFLKQVLKSNLMIRRVNIRQVMSFAGTPIYGHETRIHKNLFQHYKEKIRREIDLPMLQRIAPAGCILRDVRTEVYDGLTFGRQLASYPLLIGIPERLKLNEFVDIMVTGHGYRSITGIPLPVDINTASRKVIQELPGIGKKQAAKLIAGRPYRDIKDAITRSGLKGKILEYIRISGGETEAMKIT